MSKININIKATNMALTESTKKYVTEKVNMLSKLIPTSGDVGVITNVEVGKITRGQLHGDIFRAEINLEISGKFYRSVTEKDDLYAAIDEMKDDMMMILRKDSTKRRYLLRRGAGKIKDIVRGLYQWKK